MLEGESIGGLDAMNEVKTMNIVYGVDLFLFLIPRNSRNLRN